jgi:hypothetical protein
MQGYHTYPKIKSPAFLIEQAPDRNLGSQAYYQGFGPVFNSGCFKKFYNEKDLSFYWH